MPILGICLGLQLLFDSTTELGGAAGLGLLPGEVTELDAGGLKVPHIGWATVAWAAGLATDGGDRERDALLLRPLLPPAPRRRATCSEPPSTARAFACAAERDNVFGVQFHPEKSSGAGLRLLGNFAGVCARAPATA